MKDLVIMFLQGMLYVMVMLYLLFAGRELYKTYAHKSDPVVEQQTEEQPVITNQQPMYILSPKKEV